MARDILCAVLLQLFLTAVLLAPAVTAKIPWWNIKIAHEQGPNACVVEEVPGSDYQYWTECKYWQKRDICGQKAKGCECICFGRNRVTFEVHETVSAVKGMSCSAMLLTFLFLHFLSKMPADWPTETNVSLTLRTE